MTDLERILLLWHELEASGADYVLTTVVEVQGSSYRKPGACMLLAPDGRRAGTVSGGCLEAQVAQRAWWLTASGPTIQRYSSLEEDGDLPYGSGCGGVIHLLLERRSTAAPLLRALEEVFHRRISIAVATILEGPDLGLRAFAGLAPNHSNNLNSVIDPLPFGADPLQDFASQSLADTNSIDQLVLLDGIELRAWANFRSARPGLWIFGAGDDAHPLLRFAKELGWFAAVADGRSHLATSERFPTADELHVLLLAEMPAIQPRTPRAFVNLRPHDAAVLMTHSFEQDAHILASLLERETPLAYIGVLGPQRRTRELLAEAARLLNLPATPAQIERWLSALHAPTGLDLGADSPEAIALSILAEIQQSLTAASALPLHKVRAASFATPN